MQYHHTKLKQNLNLTNFKPKVATTLLQHLLGVVVFELVEEVTPEEATEDNVETTADVVDTIDAVQNAMFV